MDKIFNRASSCKPAVCEMFPSFNKSNCRTLSKALRVKTRNFTFPVIGILTLSVIWCRNYRLRMISYMFPFLKPIMIL